MMNLHINRPRTVTVGLGILAAISISLISAKVRVDAQDVRHGADRPVANSFALDHGTVTWSHDIAPIVYGNCTTCHHTGGAGPFSLMTYQDARRWAAQIVPVTKSRYMPPWLPEHDHAASSYVAFQDERGLTDAQIALIAKWASSGMPEGDAGVAPSAPKYSETWQHGTPDLILTIEQPYHLPASGTDVFRNFILPYPLKETHYIRAMEIRPSVPQIVHHANVLIDRTASYRREHPEDWKAGIPGMELAVDAGNRFDPDSSFLFWKPDTPYLLEPPTMPWRLDAGNDLILNMHLKPSGKTETVTAQVGLYFADAPPSQHPMLLQLEHDSALDIPAGDSSFAVDDSLKLTIDVDVLGVYPHAHYLGKRLEAWATLPNGRRQPLILIPGWDIDRQSVYRYRTPVSLPRGTVLHMHYVYDNSAANEHNPNSPPIRVKAGNRSVDEMAHLWLQVLPVHVAAGAPDPRLVLEEAWMQQRLRKDPNDALSLYNLASAEDALGQFKEAVAEFRADAALHPEDPRTLTGLGAALEKSGAWQEAATTFESVIATHPETCDARFDLAQLEIKHDDTKGAEEQLGAMIKECPADSEVYSALGVALSGSTPPETTGLNAEALAAFQQALTLDPNNFMALYNLGLMASRAGKLQQAIGLLSAAAKQRPEDVDAREQLAGVYAQSGRMDEATEELQTAIKLRPQDAGLRSVLSQVLESNGHLALAVEQQKEALRLVPQDADGWNNLGVMEAREGETVDARKDFLRALKIAPEHEQAAANLKHLPAD